MSDTIQQVCTGVRTMLRRPSEQKLPEDDIRFMLKRLLRGYCQDLSINQRDRATIKEEVAIDEDEVDFILTGPSVDFEPEKLEYQVTDNVNTLMCEARLVDYSAWSRLFDQNQVIASLYGPDKIAINLPVDSVAARRWFLSYRPSLLAVIQKDAPVPLPADFIPMLEVEAAILLMPLVRDDSAEWIAWGVRTLPIYAAQKQEWNNRDDLRRPGRWQHYLISSVEPQIQPIRRSDRHRNQANRIAPFVPLA